MRMVSVCGMNQKEKNVEKTHSRRIINTNKPEICVNRGEYSMNQTKELNVFCLKRPNFIFTSFGTDSLYA